MTMRVHGPPVPLRPFVAFAFGYRVPAMPAGVHRGLPSRHLTLAIDLLDDLRVTHGDRSVASRAVVGGLHTSPALIDASRAQEGVQYGLTPPAAAVLLGVPAAELSGGTVPLEALIGHLARDLVERMADSASWSERFRLLDAVLLLRLGQCRDLAPDPAAVAEAWRVVLATDGRLPVGDLAAHVGWGRRHLAERFRVATGLTPKQASRVARFEAARRLLIGSRTALPDVALRCGYADQAHLARDFKALAGCSVTAWIRDELPFVQDTAAPGTGSSAG